MADIFISYSTEDEQLAQFVYRHLLSEGVTVFIASVSLAPGNPWSSEIKRALDGSTHVIFLASQAACRSSYVQQELGYALGKQKSIVPVVWDMPAQELPGWIAQLQPLDLRNCTVDEAKARMKVIVDRVKTGRSIALALALIGAAALFSS